MVWTVNPTETIRPSAVTDDPGVNGAFCRLFALALIPLQGHFQVRVFHQGAARSRLRGHHRVVLLKDSHLSSALGAKTALLMTNRPERSPDQ